MAATIFSNTTTIPSIIYTDLSNYSISGSNSSTANLLNYFTDSLWISDNNNDQELIITFATSGENDVFVLDPYSSSAVFGTSCKLTLSAADNIQFTAGLTSPISSGNISKNTPGVLVIPFNPTTKKYWKVILTGLDSTPSAGNIWIAKTLNFKTAYDFGYKTEDPEYITNEFTALNGKTRTSQNYDGRLIYNIKFSLQDDTTKSNYKTFMSTIKGRLRPFYFIDINSIFLTQSGFPTYYLSGNIRYMHLDSDYSPITVRRYGLNDTEELRLKTKYATY